MRAGHCPPMSTVVMVPSKLMFMGGAAQTFAGCYPTYQMRLLKLGSCGSSAGSRSAGVRTEARVGTLRDPYLHANFSKAHDGWKSTTVTRHKNVGTSL